MNPNHTTTTLLVQMGETRWTTAAMQVACAKARSLHADIVLTKFIPTAYLNWTADTEAEYVFSESERDDITAYSAMAHKSGVTLHTRVVKYDDFNSALTQQADVCNASFVLTMPTHDLHTLANMLKAHQHALYTLQQPAAAVGWQPEAVAVV
jgi:hypothetical protein